MLKPNYNICKGKLDRPKLIRIISTNWVRHTWTRKHDARQPTFNEEHSTTDESETSKINQSFMIHMCSFLLFNIMFRPSASVFSLFLTIPSVFFRCVLSCFDCVVFCLHASWLRNPPDPLQCCVLVLAFVCFKLWGVSNFVWVFRD